MYDISILSYVDYKLEYITTIDINECSTNNGGCGSSICTNTIGSYTCTCRTGFNGAPNCIGMIIIF